MSKGTVKWFNDAKGYGFIGPDDGSPDVFVHRTNIESDAPARTLTEGQRVEFRAELGSKGPIAKAVRPLYD